MDKVLKAAVRSLSTGATFDSGEDSGSDVRSQISLESILSSLDQDESSAQSRVLEEESLYKIIFSFALKQKGSSRLLDELAKELKRKDMGPNSLRVCLGILSHIHIKPQKLGPLMSNTLLPSLLRILEGDPQESEGLITALADNIEPLMKIFGPYALSNELEHFISSIIRLLLNGDEDTTSSKRRSISNCLCAVSSHNKARCYYISWAFCRLISEYVASHVDQNVNTKPHGALLGLLTASRALIPLLKDIEDAYNVLQDMELEKCLFILYELSITTLENASPSTPDPSLMSANLELLHQIYKAPPLALKIKLLSTQGFSERYLGNAYEGPFESAKDLSSSTTTSEDDEDVDDPQFSGGILGSFTDKDIPLIYAGRLIAFKTLLTRRGKPRSKNRISIRCLAMSCMSSIVSLSPKVFLLTLYMDQDEEEDFTPILREIARTHFVLHEDPLLSGSTAILMGNVLRGCLLEVGPNNPNWWFGYSTPSNYGIIKSFMALISQAEISSITIKYALIAIRSFIKIILCSSFARNASLLLFEVVADRHSHWANSYWLVRTALLDLLSSVDYKIVHFLSSDGLNLQNKFLYILKKLLSDEDARVRASASEAIVNAIPNLYYPNDWADEYTESASRSFSLLKTSHEKVVRRVAGWLWELIASADNNTQLSGSLEAYFNLKRNYSHVSNSTDASILDLTTHFITSNSNFTLDISNHVCSLNVIDLTLSVDISSTKADVLQHIVRILNMISHLIEDPSLHAPMSPGGGAPSSNPSGQLNKIKEDEVSTDSSSNSSTLLGSFSSSPHYLKLFLSLKNIYGTYVISSPSVKNDPSNKFNLLLSSSLKTLRSLLSLRCIASCDEELAKEILRYLSTIMPLDPFHTLSCVQSLLSYIFKTNEDGEEIEHSHVNTRSSSNRGTSFYKYAFEIPYQEFLSKFQLPKAKLCSTISFFDDKVNLRRLSASFLKRALSLKNWNREALTSYIRLFEPIVIQALQFYTMTSNVTDQGQVLSLLIQLVKLRVNYCLLDSDKVFVGYVIRHLEYIKDGNVLNAEVIMSKIFQFLVLLSVDKFHSKVVVPVDEIVDLLTELTSTKNHRWIIPAVIPVVEVLFGNWHIHDNVSQRDLEATREKLFKLLLNYMNYPEILDVFVSKLCFVKSEGEDRWRKVSRILFDHILVLLSTQKIQLVDSHSLKTLYSFFLCLAPGTLRPVDTLLSSVLSSAVDLGCSEDVQRWLGFVVVSLCVITNQSPEEGILSRLDEFGMTSLSNNHNAKPENTLAKFLFQVIGASLSKLHQIVYSLDVRETNSFLEEEVSLLLNFVVYVLKSDRFCRVSRAAQVLAEGKDKSLLYSIEFINNIALELIHVHPYVTLRWIWILTLLKRVQVAEWSQFLHINSDDSSPNRAVLQKGSLILLCEHLCETNPIEEFNIELLTWLVTNFSHLIVESINDEPVARFVQSVHTKASLSGLFLQAIISRCQHRLSSSILFQKRALLALEHVHESHSSNLLMFLIQRVSPKAHLSLSARIQGMCCKRVEGILNSGSPRELLSSQELSDAVEHIKQNKSQKRYGRLMALLKELISEWYPELLDKPVEDGKDGTLFSSSHSLQGLKPNKPWFLSQLKAMCSLGDLEFPHNTEQCARMLMWLTTQEDIISIVSSSNFNIAILEWLFRDPSSPPLLLKTAKGQFFDNHLKNFIDKYLAELSPAVYGPSEWSLSNTELNYKKRLDSNFASTDFRNTLIKSLSIISIIPVNLLNYEKDIICLKRIPYLLALEFSKWLIFYCTEPEVEGKEELFQVAFNALNYVVKNPSISSKITMEEAAFGVHALFSLLLGDEDILSSRTPSCPKYKEVVQQSKRKEQSVIIAALKINRLFACYLDRDKGGRFWNRKVLREPINNVIIGLSRLPCFNSYVSIPLEIWKQGWAKGVPFGPNETKFPLISLEHLQEIDILKEYSNRVNAIGWSDRPQFEETWMSLLGIFSILQDDMSESDIYFLGHASALVVKTATNLLLKTLCLPHLGLSNISRLCVQSRLSASSFMTTSRGKALSALQSKMKELLNGHFTPSGSLPIYGSVNLENMSSQMLSYGLGQVSSAYILACINYYEGGKALHQNTTPSGFLLREEALANSGLDIESCLQFLFDLYSSWFKSPRGTPLVLLTEAVRSIVALSDIFTSKRSFQWMYRHFIDIWKSHPAEDEVLISLLRVGICKALSVLGFVQLFRGGESNEAETSHLTFDALMRLLESGYVSGYLPSQISTLQGVLYILQRQDLFDDVTGALFNYCVRTSIEYLKMNLFYLTGPVNEFHTALCWSLTFYILENYDSMVQDMPWTVNVLQLALSTPGKTNTSSQVYLAILAGFERLILSGKLSKTFPGSGIRAQDQVIKLATDLLTESNPVIVIPSIQLYLSTMYFESYPITKSDDPPSTPERLMHAMEQISILFDCIRRSGPKEATFLCQILPPLLVDFFPAADVINRVISEFIGPGQPHQPLLAGVMFSVFNQASMEHSNMLQDWVLSTIPTFTKRSPISHSTWCMACFFLSVPPPGHKEEEEGDEGTWLQALFPYLQTRLGSFTSDDKKLFCLVAKEFYLHLHNDSQKEKFLLAFKEVATPQTPYFELLQVI